jgi:hypothetical protein
MKIGFSFLSPKALLMDVPVSPYVAISRLFCLIALFASLPLSAAVTDFSAILRQTGAGLPATWGTNGNKAVPADYEMDPEIVNDPVYRDRMVHALKSVPAFYITMASEDLFGADHGIYSHPQQTGSESERRASITFTWLDAHAGFELNCGIRIQGGWNRRPEESPKHSFRLTFRKKYGGVLKFPLFGEAAPAQFETLILRGGNNNSWLHWSGEERRRADFIRDQWMRDAYRDMGHPSPRGLFVHLYLNGLYWGLYNLCERPDATFAAAHFGGSPKDYDSRNADKILEGDDVVWKKLFALANAGLADPAHYSEVSALLDLPVFCDFMLVNLYGANADWDRASNWYAARQRKADGRFYFFVWDGERTLEKINDNTIAFDDDQSPARLFQKLRANPEFRKLFTRRARLHCLGDGALSPAAAAKRFRSWADTIDLAVIAESARWGDYRRDVHSYKTGPYELYTRDKHWRPEIDHLLSDYFPRRTAVFLQQLKSVGLYDDASR